MRFKPGDVVKFTNTQYANLKAGWIGDILTIKDIQGDYKGDVSKMLVELT